MRVAIVDFDGCGGLSLYHQCTASWRRMFTSTASNPRACCFSRMTEGRTVQPAVIRGLVHFFSFRRRLLMVSALRGGMCLTLQGVSRAFKWHPYASIPRALGH